jgi:hypothetical protein
MRAAASEDPQRDLEGDAPPRVEQVEVVEVRVHVLRERSDHGTRQGTE